MHHPLFSRRSAGLSALALILAAGTVAPAHAETAISADRCEANKAAGKITFLTSFAYAATLGILDVVAAKERGLFDDLCLDVAIEPGSTNSQLVSANTAQIAGVGSASDVMVAIDNGADIVGVATYGNVGAIELLTMADSGIEELKDFEGKTVGYKGAIAPQFSAMMLDNGVDMGKINWVSVGYDPTILPNGNVQGLGAYKSNEPKVLEAKGNSVKEWDPDAYGVHSTFNAMIANKQWAAKNPTAIEDFLRAEFKAFDWINESDANLDEALSYAEKLSTSGYDVKQSKVRWQTELALMQGSLPEGMMPGQQSDAQWQPEADMLVRFNLVKAAPDIETAQDNTYIDAIYADGALVWPAP
ncbi:ABC transporter substrate-binding protein [Martelella sp. HB161492]|uniref:ABC transporter substrate-binding protein n=1 Tax=Martelella sp. HB161492 TaxID=2720726 RepID=UPI0015901B4D|nr:ABC transporter substrate-binding protein [Martelella sp. HB161492]